MGCVFSKRESEERFNPAESKPVNPPPRQAQGCKRNRNCP